MARHLTLSTLIAKMSLLKVQLPHPNFRWALSNLKITVQEADIKEVNDAVDAAEAAFPAWRDLGVDKRGEYLRKLSDLIREAIPELAKLETLSTGRPISLFPDGGVAADQFRYYADHAWSTQGTASTNTPGTFKMTVKEPFGVVGLIIPWNFPLINFAGKMAPALAAGNTVVLKSSEKAPLTVSFPPCVPTNLQLHHSLISSS